ncbi:MAG: ROK family transcriptional regulator [Candidatus Marinimicrobia bacterium]|nr:ROK family transcriptional regulator [Candidatus Neomarinimicrobiota bacterium]
MQTGDVRLIKNINVSMVLNLIRDKEELSGAELAKITGMRPSTISNIIKELSSKCLIVKSGKGESTLRGGKRPTLWKLNSNSIYAIGLDVEIKEITAVIIDLNGKPIIKKVFKTRSEIHLDPLVLQIKECVDQIIKCANLQKKNILGIGIAVAGVVNTKKGCILATDVLPQLDIPLLSKLKKMFPFPIIVENNANSVAVGAKWTGAAKGVNNLVVVLIEVQKQIGGLGIGIIINSELYHGCSYTAGELNIKLPTLDDQLVTLRNILSKGKILKKYAESIDDIDIHIMIDAAKKGDEAAVKYFNNLGHLIGKNIARPVAMLNPNKLIIAGDVAELGEIILKPIRNELELDMLDSSYRCLKIETSIHGRYSVAIGAASIILNKFFKIPTVKING